MRNLNSVLEDDAEDTRLADEARVGEQTFESFFSNAPIGMYRTTRDGRILMANPQLLKILGYSSFAEIAAHNLDGDAFHPQYRRSQFKERLEREGEITGLESVWERRDGSLTFIRENAKAVRGDNGNVLYYEGTIEDLTERRRAEIERQVIFEIVEGVNTTASLGGLFRLIHQAVGKVLYAENCIVGLYKPTTGLLHFEFFVDEHDSAPPPRPLGKGLTGYLLRNGSPLLLSDEHQQQMAARGEIEIYGTISASWLGVPLKTPTGIVGVLVVQHYEDRDAYSERDLKFLTSVGGQIALALARKQAEESLRKSEREYRSLFNRIADPIFVVDKETQRFVDCNDAVVRLYEYSLDDLRTMTPFDLHPSSDFEIVAQHINVKHLDVPFSATHVTKYGRHIAVEISSDEIERQGRPAWLSIARDVTERKLAEEKLKGFAEQLEQSNRELQDFASVASHDLQEPLRKILAFGDRLKAKCEESLGTEGKDYLARMQNAAVRMQTLINDLLTFSRVKTKAQPFVAADLRQIVREVVSDLEVRIEQTHGRVEVGELMTIDADPLQMRQLLQNLIGNALKFHRRDAAPLIKVECVPANGDATHNSAPAYESCQLTISDNGIGFDEKYLDRIFTVFQRLHGRGEYEGTGVGLAVCRRIAERHGGSITAHSVPGEGATFVVTLPVRHQKGEHE